MTAQPDRDALNADRVSNKLLDLAALGWVIEKLEARAMPLPTYPELHRMADEWRAKQ